jgi:hypothetical protein
LQFEHNQFGEDEVVVVETVLVHLLVVDSEVDFLLLVVELEFETAALGSSEEQLYLTGVVEGEGPVI